MPSVEPGPVPGRFTQIPPTRQEEATPTPARREDPTPTAGAQSSDLLLGPGAEFDGKLTFRGTLRIDAKFTGSIVTDDVLIVGEHARMNAELSCGSVVIHGEVNGNVKATGSVELRHTAKLRGDVTSPSLVIERGALLQGTVKLGDKDKSSKNAK
jgi:cytoskeletal protein CcmA (bactofilin family)